MAKDEEDWTKFSEDVFGDLKQGPSNPRMSGKSVNSFRGSGPRQQLSQVERIRISGNIAFSIAVGSFVFIFFFKLPTLLSIPGAFWSLIAFWFFILCLPMILVGSFRVRRAKRLARNPVYLRALDLEHAKWYLPKNRSDYAHDLEIIAKDDPENSDPDFWFLLGEDRFIKKEFTGAIAALKRALTFESHFPAAWFSLGNSFFRLQDYPAAKEALKNGLQFDANNVPMLKLFCKVLVLLGEKEKAREIFEEILKDDPDYFEQ